MSRRDPEQRVAELEYVLRTGQSVDVHEVMHAFRCRTNIAMLAAIKAHRLDVVLAMLARCGERGMLDGTMVEAVKEARCPTSIGIVKALMDHGVPVDAEAARAALESRNSAVISMVQRAAEEAQTSWSDRLQRSVRDAIATMLG